MWHKILFFVMVGSFFLACNPRQNKVDQIIPKGWINYSTKNYNLYYPPNWILDTTNHMVAMLFCPIQYADSNFQTNYNFIVQDSIQAAFTIDSIIFSIKKEIEKNIKLDTFNYTTKDNQAILTYHGSIQNLHLAWQQHLFFKKNKLYTVTLTSSIFKMAYFMPLHDSIMQHFSLAQEN